MVGAYFCPHYLDSLCFRMQLADRILILAKGVFLSTLSPLALLNHWPSQWFYTTRKGCRKPGRQLFFRINPVFMRVCDPYFSASDTATAQATVAPTMGLFPLWNQSIACDSYFSLTLFYHGLFYGERLHLLWQATSMFFLFFLCFSE